MREDFLACDRRVSVSVSKRLGQKYSEWPSDRQPALFISHMLRSKMRTSLVLILFTAIIACPCLADYDWSPVDAALEQQIQQGAFPGCVSIIATEVARILIVSLSPDVLISRKYFMRRRMAPSPTVILFPLHTTIHQCNCRPSSIWLAAQRLWVCAAIIPFVLL